MYKPLAILEKEILQTGFVNAHSHLDRAFTVTEQDFKNSTIENHLFQKWKKVDTIKRESTTEDYYNRIVLALENQANHNVSAICTFIDIDTVSEFRALDAALEAKETAKLKWDIDLKIANQTLKPLADKTNRKLIEDSLDDIDLIGGLPSIDEDINYHFDVIFSWAKSTGKRLHVHVDQLNSQEEKETELLARKTIEYGLEGKVTAVHSISLAAHPIAYRNYVYSLSKDAGLSFVSCPTAWIDHRRSETLSVTHNSITPIEELISSDLKVAIGSDNIYDIYKPFSNGCMLTELRLLLEATHYYNIEELIKIATVNGLEIIGAT